ARAIERRWIEGNGNCVSPCRIIRFAGASTLTPTSDAGRAAPDPSATDLQTAIQTAVGLAPNGGRVVVLSDGGQTQGDRLEAAPAAVRRGVWVDWVRLPAATRRDAAITAIAAPATVRRGDPVPLTLTVHSTVSGAAVLRIRSGAGAPHQQTV